MKPAPIHGNSTCEDKPTPSIGEKNFRWRKGLSLRCEGKISLNNNLSSKLQDGPLFFMNGLIGEVFVSLNLDDLVTRAAAAKETSQLYHLQDLLGIPSIPKLYYRRIALNIITSCIFRYLEFYKQFKGRYNLNSNQIKCFIKKCKKNDQINDLRQIFQHPKNKKTKELFSLQEVKYAFDTINQYFPNILNKKDSEILNIFFHTKELITKKLQELANAPMQL